MDIGEFEIISRISKTVSVPQGFTGIGDDCAIIPQSSGNSTLVSSDMLIEGTHFLLDKISPYELGWKSATVNISDIAAMGGRPIGCFLNLALTESIDSEWLDEFILGFNAAANPLQNLDNTSKWSCPILGGDTTKSNSKLCISVTVLGTCTNGRELRRSGAQVGDLICVNGPLGDSAAGLHAILNNIHNEELISCHNYPIPYVRSGMRLAATPGVHSMMDISDGIGSDLRHILRASSVSAVVDCAAIPLSDKLKEYCEAHNLDPLEFALNGGEDYKLLFTMSPDTKLDNMDYFVIGKIVNKTTPEIKWMGTDREFTGYKHF